MLFIAFVLLFASLGAIDHLAFRRGVRAGQARAAAELLRQSSLFRERSNIERANILAQAALDVERGR